MSHVELHVGDRLQLLGTQLQIEKVEAGQAVLRNLKSGFGQDKKPRSDDAYEIRS